jgi:hypothetical protein
MAMKPEIYLHIPEPCHENWDNMSPVAKGKFCSGCSKDVVDFSLMADHEVLNFFKNSSGNTCGRLHTDQLQRPIHPTKIDKKKNWHWLVASFTSLLIMSKSQAQKKNTTPEMIGKVLFATEQPKTTKCELTGSVKVVTDTTKPACTKDSVISQLAALPTPPRPQVMISGAVSVYTTPSKIMYTPITPALWLRKIMDTVKITNRNPFKIYPNPVSKKSLLHITVNDAGAYHFELFDNNSRLLHVQENISTVKHQIIDMQLPQDMSAGLYYIRMIDTRTKKAFVNKVIVQ